MVNAFYQSYYLGLLQVGHRARSAAPRPSDAVPLPLSQDTFSVLTDTLHKPGFKVLAQKPV